MLWLAGGGRRTAQAGGRAVAQNPRKKRKKKSRKAQQGFRVGRVSPVAIIIIPFF